MYPVSNAVKALFENEQRQVLRITGTDKNGASISITEADVKEDGFEIDRYSCNGDRLEIGTAIASELTLKLDNRAGKFNGIVFEGTELFVEVGIADWTLSSPTVKWIPCGYFTPDEQPRSYSTITLSALDRMTRFDVAKPTLLPWTVETGEEVTNESGETIYVLTDLYFPTTVSKLVSSLCERCSVPLGQTINNLPNAYYIISAFPVLQQQITFRDLIQWCAGIMGTNAWIDWNGNLRFSWYGASTGYVTTPANRFNSDLHEDDITITGVQYTNTQDATIVSGTDDYALDMTGNYLSANGISTILPKVNEVVNGFTYRPFSATVINAPYLWPMDMITFTDRDGNDHTCALTNVNFTVNGNTVLESRGETAQTNSKIAPSGVTSEQGFLIEQAAEKIADLDNSLTQEEIFNRLTNGGKTQGLLLNNGKVYLNASYIQTGTMVADIVKGGTLTLGGANNGNGVLQIYNEDGVLIGYWNNNGIYASEGTFSGTVNAGIVKGSLISGTSISNRMNSLLGFEVGPFGDVAIGEKPDDLSSFEDNKCPFQINNWGGVKLQRLNFYAENDSGIFEKLVTLRGYYRDQELIIQGGKVGIWNGLEVDEGLTVKTGDFKVNGTKSRIVETGQYADRLLYCYETPSPLFGDVGEGVIAEDGRCYVWLDAVFAQTIAAEQYQVFLQRYGPGECYVAERRPGCFVVEGAPGLAFGWELKAKQKDFDQRRLDSAEQPYEPSTTDYGALASQHITELQKGRVTP